MAKKKVEDKLNLDATLFKCRDILRQARNSGSFFEKTGHDAHACVFAFYRRKI